jgi:N-acetylmuramoyl-L-alanine amidase
VTRHGSSPNFDPRPAATVIDMLVLHYTGMIDAQVALDRLCDPAAKVSAHYLIGDDGTVHALVDEKNRAWHAGVAAWRGHTDINARSIGIELVNPGHDLGYRPFPEAQIAALEELAREVLARHPIPPRNVVGHADVAPTRKQDPGELFPWRRLAAAGIGLWPDPAGTDPIALSDAELTAGLAAYGYETVDIGATVIAFQRHFRPHVVDAVADDETRQRLGCLLGLAGPSS